MQVAAPGHLSSSTVVPKTQPSHLTSPWLTGAVAQGKIDITNYLPYNPLPANTLDIESKHLVCGTDGEALFLLPDMTLK